LSALSLALVGLAGPRDRRDAAAALLRSFPSETAAAGAAFLVFQPFERWWMGRENSDPSPDRPVVLLVHGYCCNRGLWIRMRKRLEQHGFRVATVNLEPPFERIEVLAEQLHRAVEALVARTGIDRLILVGHSMGGLVGRSYLATYGAGRVTRLVTLGTPHQGTLLARFGPGRCARQMRPGSDFLRKLADAEKLEIPVLTIWSKADELILPPESSRLAGAEERVLPDVGHMALVLSSVVLDIVVDELER
jgi:triacylglycerol lipase